MASDVQQQQQQTCVFSCLFLSPCYLRAARLGAHRANTTAPLHVFLGCPAAIAGAGQLETLKWLRAHGAEWNRLTFEAAAGAGQMQVSHTD
jgi:hypothetical protein